MIPKSKLNQATQPNRHTLPRYTPYQIHTESNSTNPKQYYKILRQNLIIFV